MNLKKEGIVCFDIGGTYIKSGFLLNGELTDLKETATPQAGGQAIVNVLGEIADQYGNAKAIGISTAGEIDAETGVILYASNIHGYTGLALKQLVQNRTNLPVIVENDANAAAIGELYFGAANDKKLHSFIMVSYGTGIGGAIILHKQLLRGASGSAGEIGGLITHPESVGAEQGSGSYEKYASTNALVQRTMKLTPELNNGRAIFEALENNSVRALVNWWIDEVAYGLVGAIHLLNPQAIVLGGGVMQQKYIYEQLQKKVKQMVKPTFVKTELLQASLGNQASMYGAGVLADSL